MSTKHWKRNRGKDYYHDAGYVSPEAIGFGEQPASHPLSATSTRDKKGEIIVPAKFCTHDGRKVLFTVKGLLDQNVTFGGARGYDLDEGTADVILDLAHVVDETKKLIASGPPEWLALNQLCKRQTKVIRFAWSDQKAPKGVPARFWQSALKLLCRAVPQGGHVVATCVGGHGRTGTCLAALLLCATDRSATSAIDYIREVHCEKAIETLEQERYLESLARDRDNFRSRPEGKDK